MTKIMSYTALIKSTESHIIIVNF